MANVQVKIDEQLKADAQAIAARMGLDLASTVRMFLAQMVRDNGMPFRPSLDPFYSQQNQAHLARTIKDWNEGRKNFAFHDLIED